MRVRKALATLLAAGGLVTGVAACQDTPTRDNPPYNWNDLRPKPNPASHCTYYWQVRYYVPSYFSPPIPVYGWVCVPDRRGGGYN